MAFAQFHNATTGSWMEVRSTWIAVALARNAPTV